MKNELIWYKFLTFWLMDSDLTRVWQEWRIDSDEDDDDEESGYIPVEEVQAFRKQQQLYNEKRLQLRNDLRLKFDRLCGRVPNV